MRIAVLVFVAVLAMGRARAQETQAEPTPIIPPAPKSSTQPQTDGQPGGAQQPAAPAPAPVERRNPHPNATVQEPVAGPLSGAQGTGGSGGGARPVNQGGAVGTIRVETRLVNLPVNVVDGHGAPVGGLQKQDFRIFEDGKERTIAVFERESSSPLSIVLAIDVSETVMTSERLEREAAKRFVRGILRQQDELDLMEFADTVREIVPFTNQAKRVEEALNGIQRGDATALYDAIYLASDRLTETRQDAGRRRVIVLITDGGDTAKHSQYTQALEEAERAGAMIYSIIIVPIARRMRGAMSEVSMR